jgi:general secretion pathway protein E
MQTEVNEARGLTFSVAARHLLRQDPQVLVIGEIRDQETAGIAVRAALTGHLVISTLHAGSVRSVFERLLSLCPDQSAAIASLELVLNQRLLRSVCTDCQGSGCEDCLRTGYRGRRPILELLRIDDAVRKQIRETGAEGIQARPSLQESARGLVESKITNAAEYERFFGP